MRRLGALDPASEDFASDLGDAIKTAVEANPGFKLADGGTASSGTSNAAGSGKPNGDGDGAGTAGGTKSGDRGRRHHRPGMAASTTVLLAATGNGPTRTSRRPSQLSWEKAIADGLLIDMGFNPPKQGRTSRR
jgi:hypothetical protein